MLFYAALFFFFIFFQRVPFLSCGLLVGHGVLYISGLSDGEAASNVNGDTNEFGGSLFAGSPLIRLLKVSARTHVGMVK